MILGLASLALERKRIVSFLPTDFNRQRNSRSLWSRSFGNVPFPSCLRVPLQCGVVVLRFSLGRCLRTRLGLRKTTTPNPRTPSIGHRWPSNVQRITRGARVGSLRWLGLRPVLYPPLPPFSLAPRIHVPSHPASVDPFGSIFKAVRSCRYCRNLEHRCPGEIFPHCRAVYMFMCSLPAPVGRMPPWVRGAGPSRAPASASFGRVRSRPSFGFTLTRARPVADCSRRSGACPSLRSGQGYVSRSSSTHRRFMVPSNLFSYSP